MLQSNSRAIIFFKRLAVGLSFLGLGAHFSRGDNTILMSLSFIMLIFLFIKSPLASKIARYGLVLGGLEWFRSAYFLIQTRLENGQDWARLAVIMGTIGILTSLSAIIVNDVYYKKEFLGE